MGEVKLGIAGLCRAPAGISCIHRSGMACFYLIGNEKDKLNRTTCEYYSFLPIIKNKKRKNKK